MVNAGSPPLWHVLVKKKARVILDAGDGDLYSHIHRRSYLGQVSKGKEELYIKPG